MAAGRFTLDASCPHEPKFIVVSWAVFTLSRVTSLSRLDFPRRLRLVQFQNRYEQREDYGPPAQARLGHSAPETVKRAPEGGATTLYNDSRFRAPVHQINTFAGFADWFYQCLPEDADTRKFLD